MLHVLLHMAEADGPVTSGTLAKIMRTNPVVIRRILAGLREQGFVHSEKGHGGGWQLACDLNEVTLRDIYATLGAPAILAIGHRSEAPGCQLEEAVNTVMSKAFRDAEALFLDRLSEVTVAGLSPHFRQRLEARRGHLDAEDMCP